MPCCLNITQDQKAVSNASENLGLHILLTAIWQHIEVTYPHTWKVTVTDDINVGSNEERNMTSFGCMLQTELKCVIPGLVVINTSVTVKKTICISYGLYLYLMYKNNVLSLP